MVAPRPRASSALRALPGGAGEPRGPSDEDLLAGLLAGDRGVAAQLYDHLVGPVERSIIRVFGRREQDHDDLVQASFEQIVITLTRRRFAGACSLATWASAIASHIALNALRSRRRARRVFSGAPLEETAEPAGAPVDEERRLRARSDMERVRRELAAMPAERAEAVWMHDVLGHELAEMSVILDVSVSAAQSRLVRGRKELLARLATESDAS